MYMPVSSKQATASELHVAWKRFQLKSQIMVGVRENGAYALHIQIHKHKALARSIKCFSNKLAHFAV